MNIQDVQDVQQRLVFTGGTTPEEEQRIRDMVSTFYASDDAQPIFEFLVQHDKTLTFNHSTDNKAPVTGVQVNFSVTADADKFVIGKDGTISAYTFESIMMHEIIHAITGATDGLNNGLPPNLTNPSYDYVGNTIPTENLIADGMSGALHINRASYHSTLFGFEVGACAGSVV
jgi:hypothetical protein